MSYAKRTVFLVGCLTFFVAGGCVKRSTHEAALAEAGRRLSTAEATGRDRLAGEREVHARTRGELETCRGERAGLEARLKATEEKLDGASALTQRLSGDLDRCGKKMKDETGALAAALAETKAALDEARKAKQAAEARAQLFRRLTEKFQKMIDAGALKISLRNGRMVLQLANDVLFDSGKVDLKGAGQDALREVAAVLRTLEGRQLQVAGHTDNVAIQTSRFPSNWELSTARAVNVTRFLVGAGVDPALLSAAGYGEFDPVGKNDTPEGKARNRRIEITLQPDISEMIAIPETR